MGEEALGHAHERGHREGHDLQAFRSGDGARFELSDVFVRAPGINRQHVPVQGALASPGHLDHVLDLVIGEPVEATIEHETQ